MALLVAFQEKLVYVPVPVLPSLARSYSVTSARFGLAFDDVWLRSSDGVRLHSWLVKLFPDCRGTQVIERVFEQSTHERVWQHLPGNQPVVIDDMAIQEL